MGSDNRLAGSRSQRRKSTGSLSSHSFQMLACHWCWTLGLIRDVCHCCELTRGLEMSFDLSVFVFFSIPGTESHGA